jgi:hypothetical protein
MNNLGERGPAGPPGPQGPAGPQGPQGAPGGGGGFNVANCQVRAKTQASVGGNSGTQVGFVEFDCAPDEFLLNYSIYPDDNNAFFFIRLAQFKSDNAGIPNGIFVLVDTQSPSDNGYVLGVAGTCCPKS